MLWRPLRHSIDRLQLLASRGYQIVAGADEGWFGSGQYELASSSRATRLRITRDRGQESIEIAGPASRSDAEWFGVEYPMILYAGADLNVGRKIPHKLAERLAALASIIDALEADMRKDPASVADKFLQIRRRAEKLLHGL